MTPKNKTITYEQFLRSFARLCEKNLESYDQYSEEVHIKTLYANIAQFMDSTAELMKALKEELHERKQTGKTPDNLPGE